MALSNPFSNKGMLVTAPWQRREAGGIYVGHNKQVWLYREMKLAPLQWEDPKRRIEVGKMLEGLLEEVGDRSKDRGQGLRVLSSNRSVHILMVTYDTVSAPPVGTPAPLLPFMADVLEQTVSSKALLVGVQLQSNVFAQAAKARGGLIKRAQAALASATEDTEGSLDPFREDYEVMDSIFRRAETVVPRREALEQMEAWFNLGMTPDAPIAYRDASFRVLTGSDFEIRSVMGFDNANLQAPEAQWILDASTHKDPARVVSIRAELEPASVTRGRLRRQRRKLIAADEEEALTGDLGRDENKSTLGKAEDLETYVRQTATAWLTNCSVLMARELSGSDETYADMLRNSYGIESKVLEHRQREALMEMLPTSSVRVNPFPQDINPAMVAYSGAGAFSTLGDEDGVFVGYVDPDHVPLYLDPYGAAKHNLPPVMGVFGDPGSGKASWVEAKVLTPTGWVRMGDIKVGDAVIGRDGNTHAVLGVYPQGVQELYQVQFNDGSSTTVTGDHLWSVSTPTSENSAVFSTSVLREKLALGELWSIPLMGSAHFSTASPQGDARVEAKRVLSGELTQLNEAWLWASEADRTAIVEEFAYQNQRVTPDGSFIFLSGGLPLAEQLTHLVRSIGGIARVQRDRTTDMDLYSVRFLFPSDVHQRGRMLTSIVPEGSGEAQCIAVSADDHLYVTDDFIVTHNTFACQLISGQFAIAGGTSVMVNPKTADSLAPWADWVRSQGTPAQVISMSKVEEEGGAFDPWRFCEPKMAAEVLTRHIQTVLPRLSDRENVRLREGLDRGARSGARCAAEALKYVDDPALVELVEMLAASSTLFSLGFGQVPREPWTNQGGLTLIEFDRDLGLPQAGKDPANYEPSEREGLAAMRLVTRAAIEILIRAQGGILVVDEAHHFLGSAEGRAALDRLAREGRSMGLLPIFATQRITDLEDADMETFMSRVLCMKLNDEYQADAALRLCRLEPTKERRTFLHGAGPRRASNGKPGRGAMGIYRDLFDRHAVTSIGPVPERVRMAMSTNRDDREQRDRKVDDITPVEEDK